MKKLFSKRIFGVLLTVLIAAALVVPAAGSQNYVFSPVTGPENMILALTGSPGEVVVAWWDSASTAPVVSYGVSGGPLSSTVPATAEASHNGHGYTVYSAVMTGLTPGWSYMYQIPGMPAPVEFTAPDVSSAGGFSFMYLGDVQADYETEIAAWGNLIDSARAQNPDIAFGVIGGDLVNHGQNPAEWQMFFNQAQRVFSQIPLMPVPGNHESNSLETGKPLLYLDYFTLPRNGPPGFEEEFYYFEYGDALFLMLSSSIFLNEQLNAGMMTQQDFIRIEQWMTGVLGQSDKTWKIAVMHHPAYQVVNDRAGLGVLENWAPIFEAAKIDIVFNGHQHVYLRTHPMYEGNIDYENGITYIMGNSGSKHYSVQDRSYFDVIIGNVGTYQLVNISGGVLEVLTYSENHELLDSFTATPRDRTAGGADVMLSDIITAIVTRAYAAELDIDGNGIVDIRDAHLFSLGSSR